MINFNIEKNGALKEVIKNLNVENLSNEKCIEMEGVFIKVNSERDSLLLINLIMSMHSHLKNFEETHEKIINGVIENSLEGVDTRMYEKNEVRKVCKVWKEIEIEEGKETWNLFISKYSITFNFGNEKKSALNENSDMRGKASKESEKFLKCKRMKE